MKVILRGPERREIEVAGGRALSQIARDLNLNPEAHIFVRDKTILTRDEFVNDSDVIEVFPAISGG